MGLVVKVPREVTSYKEKFLGLTKRQLICFILAAIVGIPSYLLTYNYIGSSRAGKVVFIVAMPIFAFMVYSKNELPLEKYLLVVWRHRFRPKKRVYRSEITYATIAMGEEENEQLEKCAEKKQSARKEKYPKPRKANKKRRKKNVSADIAIQDDL